MQRVIVMTAFGKHALHNVCPPVTRFVEKPFDLEVLIAAAADIATAEESEEKRPDERTAGADPPA